MVAKAGKKSNKLTPLTLRQRTGKTQQAIADALGKQKGTISGWETGHRLPMVRLSEVKLFMEVYEASLDELIEAFSEDED
jgi:transcriptional regulator with XRE-family HTH domain